MRHYQHHIGDFDRATRHLTRIERSVYRDLIELYYDTEQPLPIDAAWLCRKIIARTDEESTAVEQTLNEFFSETPTGWYHDRCEAEIDSYRANMSQKAQAGRASAEARRLKRQQACNGRSTEVEQPGNGTPTNRKPLTVNHEPEDQEIGTTSAPPKSNKRGTRIADDWGPDEELTQWAKAKRPDLDLGETVEAFKDHWRAAAGAKGLKLDWPATFRNWVRSSFESRGKTNGQTRKLSLAERAEQHERDGAARRRAQSVVDSNGPDIRTQVGERLR